MRTSVLLLIFPLCILSCGPRNEQRDQSSYTPRQHSMSEYPGSAYNDSIWYARQAKNGEQGKHHK